MIAFMAVPPVSRDSPVTTLGDGERIDVIIRLELADVIDMAAEAVHEVQPIIRHPPPPPTWRWPFSTDPQARRIALVGLRPLRILPRSSPGRNPDPWPRRRGRRTR